jgi:hypothetical protein
MEAKRRALDEIAARPRVAEKRQMKEAEQRMLATVTAKAVVQ